MSVTFTFGSRQDDGTLFIGVDCPHTCPMPDCEDFAGYGYCDHVEADEAICGCKTHIVNLSNVNASMVLERLGFDIDPGDLVGSADPDDLLGRALLCNLGRDDSGVPAVEIHGDGHAHMIECGLPAFYFETRIGEIADLAVEAKRRGVLVAWA